MTDFQEEARKRQQDEREKEMVKALSAIANELRQIRDILQHINGNIHLLKK